MGIFDSYFNPQTYGVDNALAQGLLQRLADWQWQQRGDGYSPLDAMAAIPASGPGLAPPAAQAGAPLQIAPQIAQQQPQSEPQSMGGLGSLFGGLSDAIAANPMTLMALGAGISQGGFGKGLQMAMPAMAMDRQTQQQSQSQRATIAALKARGVPDADIALAASSPDNMKALLSRVWPTYSAHNVGGTGGAFNPSTGEFRPVYVDPKIEKVQPGESLYQIGGHPGASQRQATIIASGGPERPPAGFEWIDKNDPSKGMAAISGGPATQLPSETAGRMAMMETASGALPGARRVLMQGRGDIGATSGIGVPGLVGGAGASYLNVGDVGRAQRTVTTAIEGALRAMTGAAAPASEVKRYEGMFMPSPFDSKETATQKLNHLDDFISNAKRYVTQGRGDLTQGKAARPSDPLGIR